jgi:hypothetical protein
MFKENIRLSNVPFKSIKTASSWMQGFLRINKKAITVKEMRKVDARAVSLGLPVYLMMENTGNALARQLLLGLRVNVRGKKVAIVCGLSNNGGAGELSK